MASLSVTPPLKNPGYAPAVYDYELSSGDDTAINSHFSKGDELQ